jgi:hypothetical protein
MEQQENKTGNEGRGTSDLMRGLGSTAARQNRFACTTGTCKTLRAHRTQL